MQNKTRLMYLNVAGRRVGCVAMTVDRSRNVVSYRTSVAHKKDAFSKEIGRAIALGRLAAEPSFSEVKVPENATSHQISTAVMEALAVSDDTPQRARKAAETWLLEHATST